MNHCHQRDGLRHGSIAEANDLAQLLRRAHLAGCLWQAVSTSFQLGELEVQGELTKLARTKGVKPLDGQKLDVVNLTRRNFFV